ncbi:DUF6364 family protein [soil metagenome]
MQTKLTLRLDDSLIEAAKEEAARRGTSLSRLVGELFQSLPASRESSALEKGRNGGEAALGERTSRLLGALREDAVDPEAYKRHLEEKHLG